MISRLVSLGAHHPDLSGQNQNLTVELTNLDFSVATDEESGLHARATKATLANVAFGIGLLFSAIKNTIVRTHELTS